MPRTQRCLSRFWLWRSLEGERRVDCRLLILTPLLSVNSILYLRSALGLFGVIVGIIMSGSVKWTA